jgi:hypothetical protein
MYSTVRFSRWEWAWIVPLSVVLSASITSAFGLVIYTLR